LNDENDDDVMMMHSLAAPIKLMSAFAL